jgi:transcriptional regulator with XRE-family HTH domain
MLLAARQKAGKNVADCALECGLSRTFLTMIETGKRCPELERVPAIGLAYQADVSELCWQWVTQWAPATVRYLAMTSAYESSRVLRDAAEQRYRDELAEKAATAAALKDRIEAVLAKPMPAVAPFEHHGYTEVSDHDAKGTLAPWAELGDQGDARKRK